jgi:hypothetical protein
MKQVPSNLQPPENNRTAVSLCQSGGVSGLYRGTSSDFQLELRVDVDGSRAMNRLSGDLFRVIGATTNYSGSFIVNSPTVTRTASSVTIEGLGEYTWSTEAPRVKVTMSLGASMSRMLWVGFSYCLESVHREVAS